MATKTYGSELKKGQVLNILSHFYRVTKVPSTSDDDAANDSGEEEGMSQLIPNITKSMQSTIPLRADMVYFVLDEEEQAAKLIPTFQSITKGTTTSQTGLPASKPVEQPSPSPIPIPVVEQTDASSVLDRLANK